jgi:hypothetical protein
LTFQDSNNTFSKSVNMQWWNLFSQPNVSRIVLLWFDMSPSSMVSDNCIFGSVLGACIFLDYVGELKNELIEELLDIKVWKKAEKHGQTCILSKGSQHDCHQKQSRINDTFKLTYYKCFMPFLDYKN